MVSTVATISYLREPERAAALLHPLRLKLLGLLREPASATVLAKGLDLPRQRVNYHLRQLEKDGLVELVEERKKGNCTERVVRASARSYLISPEALGELSADPEEIQDHFSSAYLVASAARTISELGELKARADEAGKRLATLTVQSEVRFASPERRQAFADELANSAAHLIAKYHDEESEAGRRFKLLLGVYPSLEKTTQPQGTSPERPLQEPKDDDESE